jgi:hypothetical protein
MKPHLITIFIMITIALLFVGWVIAANMFGPIGFASPLILAMLWCIYYMIFDSVKKALR